MKVMTLFGTRPEIIRLSQVLKRLDAACDHVVVHTGQNYDRNLSDVFFEDLEIRPPDLYLGVQASSFGEQAGQILMRSSQALAQVRPERLLLLGDTNSALAAIVAARMDVPVYHMEAGNRCYDDRVPEEVNRRIIDHCSTILMPYTHRSKDNLVREGIERERVFVIGNPIFEVLSAYREKIDGSDALSRFDVEPRGYFLVTIHRAENVDQHERLERLMIGLADAARVHDADVLVSLHPHTASKLSHFALTSWSPRVRLLTPMRFFDFVRLEQHARAVLSDSGTVQEECAIFGVPNVTLRDVTERPETIEAGSNILTGAKPNDIARALSLVLSLPADWSTPAEYLAPNVSATVAKVVLGYTSVRRHHSEGCEP